MSREEDDEFDWRKKIIPEIESDLPDIGEIFENTDEKDISEIDSDFY